MVCRVFQKSAAGAKKFHTSQSRAVNVNPAYNLELGPQQMIQPDNFQFPIGRNYSVDQFAELTRMFRGGASTSLNNLPNIQSQMNYPFTISELNLNLGGATTSQPVLRPMPQAMNQQDVMMTAGTSYAAENVYAAEINQANGPGSGSSRYMSMEHCMDLDSYWPPY